ncbi:hypothetical protein [Streptomyces pactum]|uniref:hypothetical protein n=1 Tax=Streptomyces pactum TaxID=68249 RepID=UPI0036FCCFE7
MTGPSPEGAERVAARVAGLLREEFAEYGVALPALRPEIRTGAPPVLVMAPIPLGTGFALLRVLADHRRLLAAERSRRGPGPERRT